MSFAKRREDLKNPRARKRIEGFLMEGRAEAEVDGIILTIVTEAEDPECSMGAAEAEEFLADWIRVYEELREMRDG
jgi:hypothetical protein